MSVSVSSPFLIVLHSVTPFRKLFEGVLTQRKLHPNKLCLIYNDIFCYGGVLRAVGAIIFSHIFNVVDILLIKTNSNVDKAVIGSQKLTDLLAPLGTADIQIHGQDLD